MTTFFLQFSTSSTHFFTAKILHIESIIVKRNQYGKTNDEIKKLYNSSEIIKKQAKNYYLTHKKN
jgi:hypothetical protein